MVGCGHLDYFHLDDSVIQNLIFDSRDHGVAAPMLVGTSLAYLRYYEVRIFVQVAET